MASSRPDTGHDDALLQDQGMVAHRVGQAVEQWLQTSSWTTHGFLGAV